MAGDRRNGDLWRVLLGAGASLAVIAVAIGITVMGSQSSGRKIHTIASEHHATTTTAPPAETSAPPTSEPEATTPAPTTTLPPPPTTVPPTTVPPTVPPTTAPATPGRPAPTVALTGPTSVGVGGQYQWHSQVTGAVSGTWSGTVLNAEKGAGATIPWTPPSGVFFWNDPTPRLAGGTYTITLTVWNAAGQSASATISVAYPR